MLSVGALVGGRYSLEQAIDGGGASDVFAARDRNLDRRVVVTVLRGTDPTALPRFRERAQLLASSSHPSVVGVLDYGEDPSGPFIVLEFVPGATFADVLRERGQLRETDVRVLAAELAGALAFLHERGIVHGDITSAAVLVDEHGSARLANFAFTDHDLGGAADIASLGTVLAEALTNRSAPPGEDPEWPSMLRAMTDPEPSNRPTARELMRRLEAGADTVALPLADGGPATETLPLPVPTAPPTPPPPPPPAPPPPRPSRTRRRPSARTLIALALAVVGVGLLSLGVVDLATGDDGPHPRAATLAPDRTLATTTPPLSISPPDSVLRSPFAAQLCLARVEARLKALDQRTADARVRLQDNPPARDAKIQQLDARKGALESERPACGA